MVSMGFKKKKVHRGKHIHQRGGGGEWQCRKNLGVGHRKSDTLREGGLSIGLSRKREGNLNRGKKGLHMKKSRSWLKERPLISLKWGRGGRDGRASFRRAAKVMLVEGRRRDLAALNVKKTKRENVWPGGGKGGVVGKEVSSSHMR